MRNEPILVSGGTGYVGGRLVPLLLDAGYRVRVLGRSLKKLGSRPWAKHTNIEMAQGDFLNYASLEKAANGCWAAFYLVHSMNPRHKDFAEADRNAAINMARAASRTGLERIIYLGGLGVESKTLSKHLRSRTEVAKILQSGDVPTTFLRAAMILGSGSASFEMMRYLTERLPIMITPRWVQNPVQPIAIRNVLGYLKGCLEHDETLGGTFDIGGPDIMTYRDLMQTYAEVAGLKKTVDHRCAGSYAQAQFLLGSSGDPCAVPYRQTPGGRASKPRHLSGKPHSIHHSPGSPGLPGNLSAGPREGEGKMC